MLRIKVLISQIFIMYGASCFINISYADNTMLQQQLVSIASQQAQIAGVGANKVMMLYGVGNPIAVINRWNDVTNKPPLTQAQVYQINQLEVQKQSILKRDVN